MTKKVFWDMDTQLIHSAQYPDSNTGAISQAVIPAVAYAFPDVETAAAVVAGEKEGIYYGRYGNPTTRTLEQKIAELEGGEDSIGLSSGMAAISSALLAVLSRGDHVVVTKDVYGGTYNFLTSLAPRFGISVDFVDCTNLDCLQASIKENTKAIYIETPSNPCLTVLDIEAISKISKLHSIPLIIDNTFMSPYLQKPLELGADIVVHSATKYLNGHGDVLAGFVVARKKLITFIREKIAGNLGQNLNAWESFLILRGLKTMGLRMKQHCSNAQKVAEYLENNEAVQKVYYPGLRSHPQHQLAKRQMKGMGGIVSFEVRGGFSAGKQFINQLNLAMISFSLGDPETLVQHPASMTHFSIPENERLKFGISDGLIRLSVGLEDSKDIIADLEQALAFCSAHVKVNSGQHSYNESTPIIRKI
ncbi:PLP-dependent aspartate aminotransferase family protein [Neobacillus niacini]|uniref:trans-sulfuration enzyme family protein n=1 Tax=Neobacillus niacini TaxID=86668 RepID=UPI0007ABC8A6|nr:PLP-dependent aspartate aminotransferase family protein [Neobacillus niacini]MEC1523865.1 PLP-dependent aspartate aminotransferase family protein [Neobacillus niacini]